jgi:tetratricopeptide (TPR) repeat protein
MHSLAIRQRLLGDRDPATASSLNALATVHLRQGDTENAEKEYLHAIKLQELALGSNTLEVAQSEALLGSLYLGTGHYHEAEVRYQSALKKLKNLLGPSHPNVARSLLNLGVLYATQGRFQEGRKYVEEARQSLQFTDPQSLLMASILRNLGSLEELAGNQLAAESFYKQVIDIRQKLLGPNHPLVGDAQIRLGSLYAHIGQLDKADRSLAKALAIYRRQPSSKVEVAYVTDAYARVLLEKKEFRRALDMASESVAIKKAVLGDKSPEVGFSMDILSLAFRGIKDHERAVEACKEGHAIIRATVGDQHPAASNFYEVHGLLEMDAGNLFNAESDLRKSLHIREQAFGSDHSEVARTLVQIAEILMRRGKCSEARHTLLRAKQIFQNEDYPDELEVSKINRDLKNIKSDQTCGMPI